MIIVNNKSYIGKSITIKNGKVIVDGVDVTPDGKEISIVVNAEIDTLDVDNCNTIVVNGNIGKVRSGSGDITCRAITNGSVQTGSGDIESETIIGDIQTGSGDVKADTITGNVRTGSGDIKYKNKL